MNKTLKYYNLAWVEIAYFIAGYEFKTLTHGLHKSNLDILKIQKFTLISFSGVILSNFMFPTGLSYIYLLYHQF